MPIKVLVYDDSEAMREGIDALISSDDELEIIALMPNAETVQQDVLELNPDVVLMDIDMPVINGVEAVKLIRLKYEHLPVIMLTVFDDNDKIFSAICAGASGYILKRYATEEIPGAIRMVLNGGAPMTGSVARKVLTMVPTASNEKQETHNLTQKETTILQLLVNGYSYKMIASNLEISIDTVRFHIKKIYDKLHVHSATEAVSTAIKNKLI